jgi:hypothetical protein
MHEMTKKMMMMNNRMIQLLPRTLHRRRIRLVLLFLSLIIVHVPVVQHVVFAYHLSPCTRQASVDFSFEDCYLPSMKPDLSLSRASFLMSHDAATGYIQQPNHPPSSTTTTSNGSGGVVATWSWFYSKNQIGSLYQQLNDGARALDLRPKLLSNGTVIFHHGSINIPISFDVAIGHVVDWCRDNPDELVLILSSHFDYQSSSQYSDDPTALVTAMSNVYQSYGIAYLSCADVYGWTVADTMQAAQLPASSNGGGGYLIAIDGQDYYGSFCGKDNYVESMIVTCWHHYRSNSSRSATTTSSTTTPGSSSCKTNPSFYIQALQDYVLQSANNPATNDKSQLGPPANLYMYPFNELQALWQVDNHAVTVGLAHFSNLLEDTRASGVNPVMVHLIYENDGAAFSSPISLFAVDNVAHHGNALLSVLRNTCGQSILSSSSSSNELLCGAAIPKPRMNLKWRVRPKAIVCALLILYMMAHVLYFFWKRPRLRATIQSRIMSYMIRMRRGRHGPEVVVGMDPNALYMSSDSDNAEASKMTT